MRTRARLRCLIGTEKRDCFPGATVPASASNAMHISDAVCGYIIVHHCIHALEINTARYEIRAD